MYELRQSFIPNEPPRSISSHERLFDAELAALHVKEGLVAQLKINGEGAASVALDLEIVLVDDVDQSEELMIASHYVPGPRAA